MRQFLLDLPNINYFQTLVLQNLSSMYGELDMYSQRFAHIHIP